ncbi:MAG: Crp/Fnr family transcriptional regulator [Sphingomonadales bacterium]|nr:Crp/Fnr family transcriptional regulator [Sphingomonadales bacterium]MBD3775046.1 Crp/Fnr family transcriptional regulator [Paracoccaceae bacterium]
MKPQWCWRLFENEWSRALPPQIRAGIEQAVTVRTIAQSEEIIRQGDSFSGLYCLLDGQMHVIGTSAAGDELLIGIHRPGDWIGFLAALDEGPYAFSVRAFRPSRVAVLGAAALAELFKRDLPSFRLLLQPEINVARKNYQYFIEHAHRPPMQRLAERMMALGRWPYTAEEMTPAPLDQLPQAALASATRLSRQTINSCLNALQQAGVVTLAYRTVSVIDPRRLGRIARGEENLS